MKKNKLCEAGNAQLLSNPPKNKCIHCGTIWTVGAGITPPLCAMTTRNKIIEKGLEMIGENRIEDVTSEFEDDYEYQRRNNQNKGYNQALKDLRDKLPQLADEVIKIFEENEKH